MLAKHLMRFAIQNSGRTYCLYNWPWITSIQAVIVNSSITQRTYKNSYKCHIKESSIDVQDIDEYFNGKRSGFNVAVTTLAETLNFSISSATKAIKKYEKLKLIDKAELKQNYEFLRENAVERNVIKNNVWLLADNYGTLKAKMSLVKKINIDINSGIEFFAMKISEIIMLLVYLKRDMSQHNCSRIEYLSTSLKCDATYVCKMIIKFKFLQKIPMEKLTEVLTMLLDYGMSKESILNDVWVFRYKVSTIQSRLQKAQESGVKPLKPWVVRCPEKILSKTKEKKNMRLSVLGSHSTIMEYLCEKLNCETEEIKCFLERGPKIQTMDIIKLDNIINLFLKAGYTPNQILRVPQVFACSIKTMKRRLDEMQKYGHKPTSLAVFYKTKLQYKDYIKKNIKSRS